MTQLVKTGVPLHRVFALLTLMVFMASARAGADSVDFPGLIPRKSAQPEAADLVLNGRQLLPEEAAQMSRQGQDLSLVDPATDTDIWQKQKLPAPLSNENEMGVSSKGERFQYITDLISRIGNYRFTVSHTDASGLTRNYVILASKKAHNVLLRKALLEKIGYKVPPLVYLSRFTVQFNGAFSRKTFIESLRKNTFGESERWVLNAKDENASEAQMQDAILLPLDDAFYNLAMGSLSSDIIQGRRLLNSLLIPYNLTDVPESLDLFAWQPGRIVTDGVYLPYVLADAFTSTYQDGRWMTRQIAALSRADWAQISARAHVPKEVELLQTEKLIARRNALLKLFQISAPVIPVNAQVTYGAKLQNGKLVSQDWPGYSSRFAYGDPPSPLSAPEVVGFFKSKFYSSVMATALSEFNHQLIPGTNVAQKLYDHQVDLAYDQFKQLLTTGHVNRIPHHLWTTPFWGGHLILSRDLVAGTYLGTDNLVQLVDSLGFAVEAGLVGQVLGSGAAFSVSGKAQLYVNRIYSHLKPIKSIRASLKEPFKNILIPLLRHDAANSFTSLLELDTNQPVTPEQQEEIKKTLAEFGKILGTGESLIITDTLGASLAVGAAEGLNKTLGLRIQGQDSQVVVRRLQIYKKNDTTIQIYKDPASMNTFDLSLGLTAKNVPILQFSFGRQSGDAELNFYSLNIDPDVGLNPDLVTNLRAFKKVLLDNSVSDLQAIQKPFVVKHDFKTHLGGLQFLIFKWNAQEVFDQVRVRSPEGFEKSFVYRSEGSRTGKDYQSLSINVLTRILQSEFNDDSVVISNPGNGNPGDTFYGNSVARIASFEGVRENHAPMSEAFININYKYKGWEISKASAGKILETLNSKYKTSFYWPQVLNDTKKIQLYTIDLQAFIYAEAINTMARMSPVNTRTFLTKYAVFPRAPGIHLTYCDGDDGVAKNICYQEHTINNFVRLQATYLAKQAQGDADAASKAGLQMVSLAESLLPGAQFLKMLGGNTNVFIQSRIQGFRVGDEAGETTIISNTLGELGSRKASGPLHYVQTNTEMTESEFFIYWLVNPL